MPKNIDIVTSKNEPTGQQTSIDYALLNGLWHRGAHVMVYTKTGYVLVQKRSSTMLLHPGYLDISGGGFVDAGETPEQAAQREMQEELGLPLGAQNLQLLAIKAKRQSFRRFGKQSRAFIYCYGVLLDDHHVDISHLQDEEVAWAQFITLGRARRLVRSHQIKSLGRIEPLHGFYTDLLRTVSQSLREG